MERSVETFVTFFSMTVYSWESPGIGWTLYIYIIYSYKYIYIYIHNFIKPTC